MGKLVGLCRAQLPSSLVSGFRVANRGRSPSIRCDCAGSRGTHGPDWTSQPSASPYQVLGLDPVHCSLADIRAAFRARVITLLVIVTINSQNFCSSFVLVSPFYFFSVESFENLLCYFLIDDYFNISEVLAG